MLEFYEPTIPIPASPQAELSFGYSKVEADSSTSLGRASYLWPGDPVGEGYKTIIENLGFPPQISGPLAGTATRSRSTPQPRASPATSDEPFPGMVMRARASGDRTIAQTGFSTNCQVEDAQQKRDKGDGGDPGLPSIPGVPTPPSPLVRGRRRHRDSRTAAPPGRRPTRRAGSRPQLAALVDFGGYISTSELDQRPGRWSPPPRGPR